MSRWEKSRPHTATFATEKDFAFMRALGEELRRSGAHEATPGTLGHEWALDAAWKAAEERTRSGG